ncbi:MAG TPA: hypothetical protein PKL53_08085 [Methylotenera sp.]|nr:hypothetical protein [Methylotenera sp.]HPV45807.1 hypothetical protein [Methylotenera sp.]
MVDVVNSDEIISRFYFNKKNFRSDNSVRHNEFMPPKNGRMSVYRVSGLVDKEIWEIGKIYVEPERGSPIVGRGDLDAAKIYDCGLAINPTEVPHPRHANIEGWELNTEKDRLKAMKLAAAARSKKV